METEIQALFCGVRTIERDGKPTLYLVDYYCNGFFTSFVKTVEEHKQYEKFVGKPVAMKIRIEQGNNRVNYRILSVKAA